MQRVGKVKLKNKRAGTVWQDENGYGFEYTGEYIQSKEPVPVSLNLPIRTDPYLSNIMIPFFDGLIPEGWLLDIIVKFWKVDPTDRMGLLLIACRDCIGIVSVEPIETKE